MSDIEILIVKPKSNIIVEDFFLKNKDVIIEMLYLDAEDVLSRCTDPDIMGYKFNDRDNISEEEETKILNDFIENLVDWNDIEMKKMLLKGRNYILEFKQIYDSMLNPFELTVKYINDVYETDNFDILKIKVNRKE